MQIKSFGRRLMVQGTRWVGAASRHLHAGGRPPGPVVIRSRWQETSPMVRSMRSCCSSLCPWS